MNVEEALLLVEQYPTTVEDTRHKAAEVLAAEVRRQHAEIGRLLNQLATALHHYYAAYSDAAEWEERARHLGWKDPT